MATFYCTFGCGARLADCYVRLEAETIEEARNWMYERYGGAWSMCYPSDKFEEAIGRFELWEVPFGTPN